MLLVSGQKFFYVPGSHTVEPKGKPLAEVFADETPHAQLTGREFAQRFQTEKSK